MGLRAHKPVISKTRRRRGRPKLVLSEWTPARGQLFCQGTVCQGEELTGIYRLSGISAYVNRRRGGGDPKAKAHGTEAVGLLAPYSAPS